MCCLLVQKCANRKGCTQLGALTAYAHVDAVNEAAFNLYRCDELKLCAGFTETEHPIALQAPRPVPLAQQIACKRSDLALHVMQEMRV